MNIPIELQQVEKSYPDNFTKKKILHGISLSIQPGEVFGFIGPNGAGKSTTINLLMGFTRPDSGVVRIYGREPSEPDSRSDVGYLPEGPRYYENLKAIELLRFSCQTAGMKGQAAAAAIDSLLDKLEILDVKKSPISTYSKGMKQRLGLALSMIHDPQTLILDEPMSGLDPVGRDLLKRIILDLKSKGKTIFFSSHILNDVETLCDRIGLIHKGRILYNGPALEFRSRAEDIDAAFVRRIETASEGNPSHE
jgi:ABC-2 type transport system ATP-binding protein